jgi:hypothetical protein
MDKPNKIIDTYTKAKTEKAYIHEDNSAGTPIPL